MSGLFSSTKGSLFAGSGTSLFGMTTSPFKTVQANSTQNGEVAPDPKEGNNGDGMNHSSQPSSSGFSFSGTQSAYPFGAFSTQSTLSTSLGEVMGEKKKVDWSDAHIQLSKETMAVVDGKCELNPTLVSKYSELR